MSGNRNHKREEAPPLELGSTCVAEWNPRPIRAASQRLQEPSLRPMTRNTVHPPIKNKEQDQNNSDRNQDADCNWIDSGLVSSCGRYPLFREASAASVCHLTTVFLTMCPQASGETGSFAKGTFNEDRCKFLGGYWAPLFQLNPELDHVVSRLNIFEEQFLTHSTFSHHSKDYALQDLSCQDSGGMSVRSVLSCGFGKQRGKARRGRSRAGQGRRVDATG
jgi:hypothetical protein